MSGIRGQVHGGQQPLAGAHIYVYAAGTNGWGGASQSLLTASSAAGWPTTQDANGKYYVTTDASGYFGLTGEYSCTSGQQVYVYAAGGNPGAGQNSAAGQLAVLGQCPASGTLANTVAFVTVNELSTVATAYAISGFAVDTTHVADDEAISGNATATQAHDGMANAFANSFNLVDQATGLALPTTPAGNGIVPFQTLNTLANILATCVNSADTLSGSTVTHSTSCSTLFALATSNGTPTGTQPVDTGTAAINIAHHPGSNVTALFGSASSTPPFGPALAVQPNDFSLGISFTGGGLAATAGLAIDAAGNVWIADGNSGNYPNTATELSPLGVPLSPAAGFTNSDLNADSYDVGVDLHGNAWFTSFGSSRIVALSPTGTEVSPAGGYTGSGAVVPHGLALDSYGNVWISSYGCSGVGVLPFPYSSSSVCYGPPLNASNAFGIAIDSFGDIWTSNVDGDVSAYIVTGTSHTALYQVGSSQPQPNQPGIAIDAQNNVWVSSQGGGITELSNSGTPLSPSSGYTCTGGITSQHLGIDGAGNVWAGGNGSVCELNNSGVSLSPSAGYTGGNIGQVYDVATDGSGDLWITNDNSTATELIGIATPLVTPIVAGVKYAKLGTRP